MFAVLAAPPATGHPLGASSVNHVTYVKVFPDRVSILYLLDQAEFATQADLRRMNPRELFRRMVTEVRRHLLVTVDGRRRPLAVNPPHG